MYEILISTIIIGGAIGGGVVMLHMAMNRIPLSSPVANRQILLGASTFAVIFSAGTLIRPA